MFTEAHIRFIAPHSFQGKEEEFVQFCRGGLMQIPATIDEYQCSLPIYGIQAPQALITLNDFHTRLGEHFPGVQMTVELRGTIPPLELQKS